MQINENAVPIAITTPTKDELLKIIENLDDYQARLVLSFIKTLFNLND
ncbi:MAG: hypothetical protein J6S14_08805 [Clostridia bacterium]|nr:hypothetical protein [Clostridia bacterium]